MFVVVVCVVAEKRAERMSSRETAVDVVIAGSFGGDELGCWSGWC